MSELSEKDMAEEVYNRLKALNKQEIGQVLDFVEFLKSKAAKGRTKNPLLEYIMSEADPGITLQQVRQELSSIKGNLSDVIIAGREDRV